MRKILCLLTALTVLLTLCACGAGGGEPEIAEWTRQGYYTNEDGNMLSVVWMEDTIEPGWYVGCMLGEDLMEDSWGDILPQVGNALHGTLTPGGSQGEITVTVTEEGEDGLKLAVEGGETYHFLPMEMPEATIIVTIHTEGLGNIAYAEGETEPEVDPEWPYQSAQINLGESAVYTFLAWPNEDTDFIKWTKNGEDYSTEPQITVNLDESAQFVAVFTWPGMANPWRDATEEEARELCPKSFVVPEGADNVTWMVMDAADGAAVPGALVQLSFDWNGNSFVAREQLTGDQPADLSGMYYDWTDERDVPMSNWMEGSGTAHLCRFVGEGEYVDLCTWYDVEVGVSYALGINSADLEGFDLLAVAEAMYG